MKILTESTFHPQFEGFGRGIMAGTTASAFWILALNAWMHTPTGFEMIKGQAHVTSWFEVVLNPSFP